MIPAVDIVTTDYEREQGSLTHSSNFGLDPLEDRQDLIKRRDDLFHAKGLFMRIYLPIPFLVMVIT